MVTMEDTQGREYEINPDGVAALEALGWTRISDEAPASDEGEAADSDEAPASDEGEAADETAAPRRGRPRTK